MDADASRENLSSGFPTRSNTNWAVQSYKMARGLNVQINKEEKRLLHYLCSGNKGADRLRGNVAAGSFAYLKRWFSHEAAYFE